MCAPNITCAAPAKLKKSRNEKESSRRYVMSSRKSRNREKKKDKAACVRGGVSVLTWSS